MANASTGEPVVSINDLSVSYTTVYGTVRALNRVSVSIVPGESVAIVGESGCGKSTLGHSIVRLLPPNASYDSGKIMLDGQDVIQLSNRGAARMRGKDAFMIFQDPLNSLNPVKRVDVQLLEAIRMARKYEGRPFAEEEAYQEAIEGLTGVRMPDPDKIMKRYPHQLSGGQIQRVVIAMGLIMKPKLLIADEPTSALDVTIQAQVLKLLRELQNEYSMSIIFITHDINVAYAVSDRMIVMYAGEVAESGPANQLTKSALHPYSQALIKSIPRITKKEGRLTAIEGSPPNMIAPPDGCRFHPRCPFVMDVCRTKSPLPVEKSGESVRCFLYDGTNN
jgi:peptide/nickel transport system ATP-binding protein